MGKKDAIKIIKHTVSEVSSKATYLEKVDDILSLLDVTSHPFTPEEAETFLAQYFLNIKELIHNESAKDETLYLTKVATLTLFVLTVNLKSGEIQEPCKRLEDNQQQALAQIFGKLLETGAKMTRDEFDEILDSVEYNDSNLTPGRRISDVSGQASPLDEVFSSPRSGNRPGFVRDAPKLLKSMQQRDFEKEILKDEINSLQETVTVLTDENAKLKSDVQMERRRRRDLELAQEVPGSPPHTSDEIALIQDKLDAKQRETDSLSDRMFQLEIELNEANRQCDIYKKNVDSLESLLKNSKENYAELATMLQNSEAKYADLSRRNDEQSSLIEELRGMIFELRSEKMETDSLPSPSFNEPIGFALLRDEKALLEEQLSLLQNQLQKQKEVTIEKEKQSEGIINTLTVQLSDLVNRCSDETNQLQSQILVLSATVEEKQHSLNQLLMEKQDAVENAKTSQETIRTLNEQLSNCLNRHSDEISHLQNKMLMLSATIEEKQNSLSQLMTEKQEAVYKEETSQETIRKLNEEFSSSVSRYSDEISHLQNKMLMLSATIEEKQISLNRLMREKQEAVEKENSSQETIKKLNEELSSSVNRYSDEINSLQSQVSMLSATVEEQNISLNQLMTEKQEGVKKEETSQETIRTLNEKLSNSLSRHSDEISHLQSQISMLSATVEKKQQSLNQLLTEKQDALEKERISEEKLSNLNDQLSNCDRLYNKSMTEKEILMNELNSRIVEYEAQCFRLEQLKVSKETRVKELEECLQMEIEEKENLKNQIEETAERRKELESNLLSENQLLNEQLNDVQLKLVETNSEMEYKSSLVSTLMQEVQELREKLSKKNDEVTRHEKSKEKTIETYVKEVELGKSRISELSEQLRVEIAKSAELKLRLEHQMKERDEKSANEVLVSELLEKINKFELDYQQTSKAIEAMNQQLSSLRAENEVALELKKELESKVEQYQHQVIQKEKTISELRENSQKEVVGKNILEDIQKDLDTKCKEVEELAKYCREVKDRYHKLREMYEESTKKLNTEIDTRSKMENRIVELRDKLSKVEKENESNKNEILLLKAENANLIQKFKDSEARMSKVTSKSKDDGFQSTMADLIIEGRHSIATSKVFKKPILTASVSSKRESLSSISSAESLGSNKVVPSGTGKMFNCDEEDGEFFTNASLADLKAGRCVVEDIKGRMSELHRRNSLYPHHLRSAYPVEFGYEGLRSDVPDLTAATENLSLLTPPAHNTRKRKSLGAGANVSHFSLDASSASGGSSDSSIEKRRKKEALQTSYHKPGLPTPSRNVKNSSMSATPTDSCGSRTPLGERSNMCQSFEVLVKDKNKKQATPSIGKRLSLRIKGKQNDENKELTPKKTKIGGFRKPFGSRSYSVNK